MSMHTPSHRSVAPRRLAGVLVTVATVAMCTATATALSGPSEPTTTTVAFPTELPFPVVVDYQSSATNSHGQTNQTRMAIGPAYRPTEAPAVFVDGRLSCPTGQNDAVFPFYIETTSYNGGASTVRFDLSFSQSVSGVADAVNHPMTIQFNYLDGPACVDATQPDPATTDARVVWDTMVDAQADHTVGYFIVADYWDTASTPVGAPSAMLAISPTINRDDTSGRFDVYGAAHVIDYVDPASGDTYGAVAFGS